MQAQSAKDNTKKNKPQHLATNIEYKLKPHRRRTKFPRTKIGTCSNVTLIPISVYKLMYKDKDCTKLEPSNKAAVKTYTTEKIKIVGSCKMFVVHPDTKLLQEVTFQVTSYEGSVIASCATSIELGLIHPHTNLNEVPEEGSLIYSIADMPKNKKNKKCQTEGIGRPRKPKVVIQSVTNTEDRQSANPEIRRLCSDKSCQSTRCYKNINK